ncbi:MAG: dTMP kinase [Bdellovibrionales bacterium]|jgi:dTMP kinase|nr:dTMP kinase [Bdellovibrionales bacterium]
MTSNKGVFITLEGGDGTGKSTQIRLLADTLSAAGVNVVTTREPGGTPQAERIRNMLLQRDSGTFDPLTEAMLMFSARREHLVNKIWPAMDAGQWVISDRFADSTRAFQGFGMGLDMGLIEKLYTLVAGDFHPDLTLIFDIEPEAGLARSMKHMSQTANIAESTEDRYERMGLAFHSRLREGFLKIAHDNPARCVVIDAADDILTVHRKVVAVITERFGLSLQEAKHG